MPLNLIETATNDDKISTFHATPGRELVDGVVRFSAVARAKKGSVKVETDRGWLRLRWSWQGRRFNLAMGLPDEPINQTIAERKA